MATLAAPSLSKLITNVRNLLNQPNPNNSFWSDGELIEYINEGIRVYFGEVVKGKEGQFTTTTTLNTVSGTETVALPTDFFEAKALYIQRSNRWEILDYHPDVTSDFGTDGGTNSSSYKPYYFFRGGNIVLRPTPGFSATGVLNFEYVQFPDTLVNGGDALTNQVSPIFKQLIEMYGVYKAKLKESMVTGVAMHKVPQDNLATLYEQFKNVIEKRSAYPEFVQPFNPESA